MKSIEHYNNLYFGTDASFDEVARLIQEDAEQDGYERGFKVGMMNQNSSIQIKNENVEIIDRDETKTYWEDEVL